MKHLITLIVLCFSIVTISLAQGTKLNVDGSWKIKTIKDSGKMIPLTIKENTIFITSKTNTLTAFIGCNRMSSSFEFVTSDILKPIVLSSTRKSCKGELQGIEDNLKYVLEQTNSVRKNGARIEFFKDTELLIVLERQPTKK